MYHHNPRPCEPREIDAPSPAPRAVSAHPLLFVLLSYVALVTLAAVFFLGLGATQNNSNDSRNLFAVVLFAIVLAFPFCKYLIAASRRPRLPRYTRRR